MTDWQSLGLKVGLEIHQQLDTDKLFCRCPSVLEEQHDTEFVRLLRPAQSELGELDRAAVEQARRHLSFRYLASRGSCCLVEADEEPPHDISERAVRVGIQVARMLRSTVADEVQVMRKIVIDGSNTTGFQRTCLLAQGGRLTTAHGAVGIQAICLEEDAARKVEEKAGVVTYKLDRLGIPLLEIATAPDIHTPEHARDAALALGQILRATGNVKRGLGTIRQDLNISIAGGARVEVKGVQELRLLPLAVEKETARQKRLVEVRDALHERSVERKALDGITVEVTHVFKGTASQIVAKALAGGGTVLALKLPGFAGLLGKKTEQPRLGSELAQRARIRAGVKGLFQSDELPEYGIAEAEVGAVREALRCSPHDAFVLVAEQRDKAAEAIEAVRERAAQALEGVPEETREVLEDGTTRYTRPLPGRARMYPETDVPPFPITEALLKQTDAALPEMPDAKEKRFLATYKLNPEEAKQLVRLGWAGTFEEIVRSAGADEKSVARVFLNTIPELAKEGVAEEAITPEMVKDLFRALHAGEFAKEAIPQVLKTMAAEGKAAADAAQALGLGTLHDADVRGEIAGILDREEGLIAEKGERALSALMGEAMKALRGKADGQLVSRVLKEELAKRLGK